MSRRRFLAGLRGETKALGPMESKSAWVAGLPANPITGFQVRTASGSSGQNRADGWDMEAVIAEGYERSVWVYRCVELYAQSQSRLPFRIGRNIGEDDEEVVDDHPLYRVLNKRANPLETGRQFRKRLSAQVLLSKRGAFVEVTKSRAGTITRLDLLDPSRVRPMPSDNGDYLDYFEYVRMDGEVREIDPERIRWIREPHPTDPFSGTTPLEAAGISVELDHLARLYNVTFIRNDSRPGGVLAVDTDEVDDAELERIERKLGRGAHHAGELAVIGTGQGGVKYVDTTTRPRDMAYAETRGASKEEILAAFNIGDTLLGSAEGRTFDNAEQELWSFWSANGPMAPHLELIAGAFDGDFDDEFDGYFDTSSVEALELPLRKKREEALKEFQTGLRSMDEYRPLAKLPPLDNPQSRALWIAPAKAPVAANEADAAALLGEQEIGGAAPDAPVEGGGTAADAVAEARGEAPAGGTAQEAVEEARQEEADAIAAGTAEGAVDEARSLSSDTIGPGDAADVVAQARLESKALEETDAAPTEHDAGDSPGERAELAAAAALEALLARQQGVTIARLESPKARKGTRFWRQDGPNDTRGGDDPLDAEKAVDAERWSEETLETLAPIVQAAVADAGGGLFETFGRAGVIAGWVEDDDAAALAGQVGRPVTLEVLAEALRAVVAFLADLTERVNAEQLAADDIDAVTRAVREFHAERAPRFARGLGESVGRAAVNGGMEAAAHSLTPMPGVTTGIVRRWVDMDDDRVRPTHDEVGGTVLPVGEPFPVGAAMLRYPKDPLAPLEERINCRCRCTYKTAKGTRLLAPPLDRDEEAAA